MRGRCKANGAPQEFQWPAVMPTSQHEEAELGRDCPFFSGKQGCPFAQGKDILCPYNAAVSVSKLWQLERAGTIASSFGCAYDSTLHFVCSLPQIVYPYNRIVCCLLIRSRHVLWEKHQSTHEFSFIRDSSLWYMTLKSSLGELHAKHPQFSSFRLKRRKYNVWPGPYKSQSFVRIRFLNRQDTTLADLIIVKSQRYDKVYVACACDW